ncbi:nuclear transport factor 2 family protein [Streptomyces hydrogenans]|uniref:nuclear transport factor 2 family protein n=1 Tax=Streptomyces hydrogenans TaxID=1873719 RepID=UPI0038251D04
MTASPDTIAVLGLGRMGAAMAARLAAQGRDVVGWTRSGRVIGAADITDTADTGGAGSAGGFGATKGIGGAVRTVGDPRDAVARADVVILALFDGPACREVLGRVRDVLRPDAVVVNTCTVAPAEADELARLLGPSYVHAPVLGSVPAVAAGTLGILAASGRDEAADAAAWGAGDTRDAADAVAWGSGDTRDAAADAAWGSGDTRDAAADAAWGAGDAADAAAARDAVDRVRPVLEALGTVRRVDGVASAAALKLVANSGLAGAVLGLRDALRHADALGLPRPQVLDLLELGQLGGLVARKRPFLEKGASAASGGGEFTVGALAKDMDLLAGASDVPVRDAAGLAGDHVDPGADIALAAATPAPDDAVLAPLRAYLRGHATGDPAHFRDAFLPGAHIEGVRESVFVSWTLDEYCALFPGRPAPDEPSRSRRIDSVGVHGTVATATMTLAHGPDTFTDVFLLVRGGEGWRIANKAYHRHI